MNDDLKEKIQNQIIKNITLDQGVEDILINELFTLFEESWSDREKELIDKIIQKEIPVGLRGCETCRGYGYYFHGSTVKGYEIELCSCLKDKAKLLDNLSKKGGDV